MQNKNSFYLIPLLLLLIITSVCVAGTIPTQYMKCIPKWCLRKENSRSGVIAEPIRAQQNVGPFFIYKQRKERQQIIKWKIKQIM